VAKKTFLMRDLDFSSQRDSDGMGPGKKYALHIISYSGEGRSGGDL